MARVASLAFCCLLQAWLVLGAVYTPSGGPVYVNPAAPAPAPSANAEQFVTQTVYGFLDFTTTIGNTVMVFSPQSAPAAEEPKPPSAPASVIETKPPPTATAAAEIKPSKTGAAKSSDKKASPSVSPAPPPKKPQAEAKPSPSPAPAAAPAPSPAPSPSPAPAPVQAPSAPAVSSVVEVRGGPAPQPAPPSSVVEVRGPASVVASKVEVREGTTKVEVHAATPVPPPLSSVVEVRASGGDENNVDDPEYDFLSRQPAQIVDETYKVINLKPSSKFHKNRASAEVARPKAGNSAAPAARPRPTPTAQGPRILKTAAPTLGHKRPAPALDPTPAGSLHEETDALPLEQLFASQPALNRASRRPAPAPAFSSRFHRNRAQEEEDAPSTRKPTPAPAPAPAPARSSRPQPAQTLRPSARKNGFSKHFGRTAATATPELATVSVYSGETSSRRFGQQSASANRRSGFRPAATADARPQPTATAEPAPPSSRRYKTRTPQPSAPDAAGSSTSLYKFKLSRPAGRWSYKTTPKPRVSIRRQDEEGGPTPPPPVAPAAASAQSPPQPQAAPLPDDAENEPAARLEPEQIPSESATAPGSADSDEKPGPAAETIKVEISTPADFSDVYYELATIKSPYTFQVGTVKNTRYITVTSTFAKTLTIEPTAAATAGGPSATVAPGEEPLTENLLASTLTPHYDRHEPLDSSIATLPPIALAGDASTPPLETLTETFSTTQLLLKTHILPVIRDGTNTTRYTLVQSYHVTRLVTALKTLPPMEVYHFVPSKTLTDLNTRLEEAGSELHLELDFGEDDEKETDDRPLAALRALAPDLDLANVGSDFDLADVDRARLPELQQHLRLKKAQKPDGAPQNQLSTPAPQPQFSPEQLQQLALLRFLNPAAAAALPQVITTSRPVVKVETLYESHVIPVFNGQQTSYSTISRPVATVSKTEFEVATSTLPLPPVVPPVVPQNPLFPNQQQQQQFAITSSPLVTQTVVTATDSKVLKLTFGAKTAYTTLYSTRLVPTMLTTYLTGSVPVQPTAPAFGGFFPPAYPQFPFVG